MTTPTVGTTHHIVVWPSNSQAVGLFLKPRTYRVLNAPTFVPRLAVGDPRGLDFALWRSFVQRDFSGGAGQWFWDGDVGNDRFSDSSFVDLGIPPLPLSSYITYGRSLPPGVEGIPEILGGQWRRSVGNNNNLLERVGSVSAVAPAMMPTLVSAVGTSATLGPATYATVGFPVFVQAHSERPTLFHSERVWQYQPPDLTRYFGSFTKLDRTSPFRGYWTETKRFTSEAILSVTQFSNAVIAVTTSQGIVAYTSTDGVTDAYWAKPAYSTLADFVLTYEGRLWKGRRNTISHYDFTSQAWSVDYFAGAASGTIVNSAIHNGRLVLGRTDSLWVYEAGRTYELYNFQSRSDLNNCKVFFTHRGCLYFNIRGELDRLTSGGLFEAIPLPKSSVIYSATGVNEYIYIVALDSEFDYTVYRFNTETGAISKWFNSVSTSRWVPRQPFVPTITNVYDILWLHPMTMTGDGALDARPISGIYGINHIVEAEQQNSPNFAQSGNLAWLHTSLLNFGYPNLDKILNGVKVTANLRNSNNKIRVYYKFAPGKPSLTALYRAGDGTNYASANSLPNQGTNISALGYRIYIGFSDPVLGFDYEKVPALTDIIGLPFGGTHLEFYLQAGWTSIQNARVSDTGDGRDSTAPSNTHGWFANRAGGRVIFDPDLLSAWAPVAFTTGVPEAYYYRITTDTTALGFAWGGFKNVRPLGSGDLKWPNQWNLLGTIDNVNGSASSDYTTELAFPTPTVGRAIMLRFEFESQPFERPVLSAYEVEWLPIGPNANKIQVTAVVQAQNKIEGLNGVLENSAGLVNATLWSLNGARIPYIVSLPYPNPVGHTRRMRVTITDPGVVVPILQFDTPMETEIPILLEEI